MDICLDGCLKSLYRKRKSWHGYNPWKHETVLRKRRLSDKGLVVNSDGGLSSESVTTSPHKGESGTHLCPYPHASLAGWDGFDFINFYGFFLLKYRKWCFLFCNKVLMLFFLVFAVKFSIKSFRIPDLFIEVRETATVGSLKVCV